MFNLMNEVFNVNKECTRKCFNNAHEKNYYKQQHNVALKIVDFVLKC